MLDDLDLQRSSRLICEECSEESDVYARGWEGHLALEDDGTELVLFFCPRCADDGFG